MKMLTLTQNKLKLCRVCGASYTQRTSLQVVCSVYCSIQHARRTREATDKREQVVSRKELRVAKEAVKTRRDHLKEAQVVFNSWVRQRDKDLPCISSGRMTGSFDAGHYRSVGSSPELRFEPLNCHRQTVHDNQHLHGNLIEYRKRLIERIGLDRVEWLEGKHEPKKYSIPELIDLKAEYKLKLKGIKN